MATKGVIKKSLSYYILLSLEKAVDGYVRFEDFTYHHYRYRWGIPDLKQSELSQALKRLRERGLVEENRVDTHNILLKLTDLGREALGEDEFDESKWDGKWRIVIFDIPEQKRIIRDMFRRKLKHWGFKSWQQSVWVTKNNVTEKLRNSIKELGLEGWIAVVESDNVSTDNIIFHGR